MNIINFPTFCHPVDCYLFGRASTYTFFFFNDLFFCEMYLSHCPRGVVQLHCYPDRDAHHGGQGQDPAYPIAPPWVYVVIVVLQRSVLDQGKHKRSLKTDKIWFRILHGWILQVKKRIKPLSFNFLDFVVVPLLASRGCSCSRRVTWESVHIENERETHQACCRGEVHPAVLDDRAGAITNHVLYVVIETVGTCHRGGMRENVVETLHQYWTIMCVTKTLILATK